MLFPIMNFPDILLIVLELHVKINYPARQTRQTLNWLAISRVPNIQNFKTQTKLEVKWHTQISLHLGTVCKETAEVDGV